MARIPNPYIVGTPIPDPDFFYGRESLLSFVRDTLNPPQQRVVVLYGQRRIGKTSVLYELGRRLSDEYHPVYFDLMGQANRPLTLALYEIANNIADDLEIAPPTNFNDPRQFRTYLEHACTQLSDNKPILLLFDEFDDLSDLEVSPDAAALNLFDYLRDLLNIQLPVAFVFVVGRRLTELPQNFQSILKQAPSRRVAFLSEKDTEILIRHPAANTLNYTPEAIKAIFELSSGHPYFTQLICFELFRLAQHRNDTTIHATDVEAVLESAIETGKGGLAWFWEALPLAERFIMSALAEACGESRTATTEDVRQVMRNLSLGFSGMEVTSSPVLLEKWEILRQTPTGFQFTVDLVRRWILQEHPLSQARREVENLSPRANRYFANAREAHQAGEIDLAIEDYSRALSANPNHFRAQLGLSQALEEQGDLAAANQAYTRAYELDKVGARDSYARSYDKLAEKIEQQGELEEALLKLQQAQTISPTDTRHMRIAETMALVEQRQQAQALRVRRIRRIFAYLVGIIVFGLAAIYFIPRFLPADPVAEVVTTAVPGQTLIWIADFQSADDTNLTPEAELEVELSQAYPEIDFMRYTAVPIVEADTAYRLAEASGAAGVIYGEYSSTSLDATMAFAAQHEYYFDQSHQFGSIDAGINNNDVADFATTVVNEFQEAKLDQLAPAIANDDSGLADFLLGRLFVVYHDDPDTGDSMINDGIAAGSFERIDLFLNAWQQIVFVPSGSFEMGRSAKVMGELCLQYLHDWECDFDAFYHSEPVRSVFTKYYFIDKYEVTNGRYQDCVDNGSCSLPAAEHSATVDFYYGNEAFDNFPVLFVSWDQAQAYCEWVDGRLPTAAEWEKAARWHPLEETFIYPWGNTDPNPTLANFTKDVGDTTEVGFYATVSPLGIYDTSGNVWEWTNDWFEPTYYQEDETDNPTGPSSSTDNQRVIRGGAYFSDNFGGSIIDPAFHTGHQNASSDIGFRCAYDYPYDANP